MILLTDANVLIDLWHVDGLTILPQVGGVEVLDVILNECDDPRQPGLREQAEKGGIRIVKAENAWVPGALQLRTSALSLQDCLNLYYAWQFGRILLTNDLPMRKRCEELQIGFHGTLWVVRQVRQLRLVTEERLCEWLSVLSQAKRRLPSKEIQRLKQELGCP